MFCLYGQYECKVNHWLKMIKSMKRKRAPCDKQEALLFVWLRGPDLNRRPSGYEPDELPLLHPASFGGANCSVEKHEVKLLLHGK